MARQLQKFRQKGRHWCLLLLGWVSMAGCTCVEREFVTGPGMCVNNTFAHPGFDHSSIVNVLVLPVANPRCLDAVEFHRELLTTNVIRGFGKFNYFNLQFDPGFWDRSGPPVDLSTNFMDRVQLGAIGKEYNAQAVLQVAIVDFQPYPPLRLHVKGVMVDTVYGERIWAFDHVFDSDDADLVNLMRVYWNNRMAGGHAENRFAVDRDRPEVFNQFVFYTMAQTYGDTRVENECAVRHLQACDDDESVCESVCD